MDVKLKNVTVTEKDEVEPDKLEIVLLTDKVNKHYEVKFNSEYDYEIEINNVKYKVKKDCLFKRKKSLFERCRHKFIIFFKEGECEPLKFDFSLPKVNSRILYYVVNSQTLSSGLTSIFKIPFKLPFQAKTVVMIAVVAVVAVVLVYFISNGMIHL